MQKWEYYIYYTQRVPPTAIELSDWGEDGWELVTVIPGRILSGGDGYLAYFKRPAASSSD